MGKETKELTSKRLGNVVLPQERSVGVRENLESPIFFEVPDFKRSDPWSIHMRNTIKSVGENGGLRGNLLEAGVGDGRNIITALATYDSRELGDMGNIVGVDVDGWRINLARRNFEIAGIPSGKYEFYETGIVDYLLTMPEKHKIAGWGIACLPQAPVAGTLNHADGADPSVDSLEIVEGMKLRGNSVNTYGLTLNAAFLTTLWSRVDQEDFNLLIILSDRIPPDVRKELFEKTHWKIKSEYKTDIPVPQDPDTGISYVSRYDDGRRFYQSGGDGRFTPISAEEAEERRVNSLLSLKKELDVYHYLSVYHLLPNLNSSSELRGGVIYEKK